MTNYVCMFVIRVNFPFKLFPFTYGVCYKAEISTNASRVGI